MEVNKVSAAATAIACWSTAIMPPRGYSASEVIAQCTAMGIPFAESPGSIRAEYTCIHSPHRLLGEGFDFTRLGQNA
jgi:hypothetical protein